MAPPAYGWMSSLRVQSQLARDFLTEFLGTFVLVAIGDGGMMHSFLDGPPNLMVIAYTWQMAVFAGVLVAVNTTGGQVNPIVTVSLATIRKLPWRRVPGMVIGQYLGAFLASVLVYVVHYEALKDFDPDGQKLMTTAKIWTTFPREFASLWTVFFDSVVSIGLLMIAVMAAIDKKNGDMPKWMHPLYFGFFILAVAVAYGLNNMAPINPARDVSARIFIAIAGWGADSFRPIDYQYWWIAGILGPHVGGIVGTWIYYLFVELHWPEPERNRTDGKEMQVLLKTPLEGDTVI